MGLQHLRRLSLLLLTIKYFSSETKKLVIGMKKTIFCLHVFVSLSTALCLFSSQAYAKRWDPSTLHLKRIELAPNVYGVIDTLSEEWLKEGASAATSAGFIVGEKGVFVIESMVNARLGGQLLGLINEVTRKPILYVANTSYHGDHAYGNYLFPNATIIQHDESKKYTEENWDNDLNFMVNMFGHPEGYDGMRDNSPRTGDMLLNDSLDYIRIDLGDRIVEVRRFGFGQTLGDLQVWLPDAKVLWVGNTVIGPAPLVPWLTEGGHKQSLDTLRRIKAFLPKDAVIASGHSVPFKVNDKNNGIDHHIKYLSALDQKAHEAVTQGMSLMETVDYAEMAEFNGYDLYNWNHKQMNVPCAYKYYMKKAGKELPEEELAMSRHCHN